MKLHWLAVSGHGVSRSTTWTIPTRQVWVTGITRAFAAEAPLSVEIPPGARVHDVEPAEESYCFTVSNACGFVSEHEKGGWPCVLVVGHAGFHENRNGRFGCHVDSEGRFHASEDPVRERFTCTVCGGEYPTHEEHCLHVKTPWRSKSMERP